MVGGGGIARTRPRVLTLGCGGVSAVSVFLTPPRALLTLSIRVRPAMGSTWKDLSRVWRCRGLSMSIAIIGRACCPVSPVMTLVHDLASRVQHRTCAQCNCHSGRLG